MKRILTLGIVLALMAALVIPGAVIADSPTTQVTGQIGEAEILVTAPGTISFGQFVVGDNIAHSVNNGTVAVTSNSRNETEVTWQVTAADATNGGFMKNGATPLNSKLEISKEGTTYAVADTGVIYTGNGNGTLPFWAKQNIVGNETVGEYSITITFTGQLTF